MNVVIVGYGRMGKLIESILVERGHKIVRRVDSMGLGDTQNLTSAALTGADGVIEFALAEGILDRIALYAEAGVKTVIGTTGWNDSLFAAESLYKSSEQKSTGAQGDPAISNGTRRGALLWGSNFSLGAHMFFRLSRAAARLVNKAEEYDVSLIEYHHNKKADYPSGTALTAAEGVLAELDRKKRIIKDLPDGPIPPEDLQVASVRVGSVPGIHEMRMDSPADFLTVRHEARNRGGLALGAVRGLEWLEDKTGWFEAEAFFDDLLV